MTIVNNLIYLRRALVEKWYFTSILEDILRRLCNLRRCKRHRMSWTYNVGYATDVICTPLRWLKIETDIIYPTKITDTTSVVSYN